LELRFLLGTEEDRKLFSKVRNQLRDILLEKDPRKQKVAIKKFISDFPWTGQIRNDVPDLIAIMTEVIWAKRSIKERKKKNKIQASILTHQLVEAYVEKASIWTGDLEYLKEVKDYVLNNSNLQETLSDINTVEIAFRMKLKVLHWAKMMSESKVIKALEKTYEELPNLDSLSDLLLDILPYVKSYGLKSCWWSDDPFILTHNRIWVLNDRKIYTIVGNSIVPPDAIAVIDFAERPKESVKATLNVRKKVVGGLEVYGFSMPYEEDFTLLIGGDGQITVGRNGMASLKTILEGNGLEKVYMLLRFHLMTKIFDLTVPVKRVRNWPILAGLIKAAEEKDQLDNALKEIIPIISLPRIKYLSSGKLDEEISEEQIVIGGPAGSNGSKRGLHWVPGFRRPLPKGYNVSQQAIDIAWDEERIILIAGETYVKGHPRGSGECKSKGNAHNVRNRGD
jgi:hypothetical protein